MKNIISILFLVLISVFSFSQTITFDKTYDDLGYAWQLVERKDSSIIVVGNYYDLNRTKFRILNISKDGSLKWFMDYDSLSFPKPIYPIALSNNNNLLIAGNSLNSYYHFTLLKVDKTGNILWRKNIQTQSYYRTMRVNELEDKNILVLSAKYFYPNFTSLILSKIDSSGNLQWQKEYNATGSANIKCNLFAISTGFIINSGNNILKIDSQGNVIWNKPFLDITALGVDNYDNVIFYKDYNIRKLNKDGDLVWEKYFYHGNITYINRTNTDGFIVIDDNKGLFEFNAQGEVLWNKDLRGLGNFITPSSSGYLICGGTSFKSWLLKTDSVGEYKALEVVNPSGPGFVNIFNQNYIEWFTNNVNKINIDLSTDNGISWQPIIHNYPAEPETKYNWLPDSKLFSDSCFIKIIDANDYLLFDLNDHPFSISSYKPVSYFSGNEILMWIGNNGLGSHDPRTDGSGFYWPGGDEATISAVFNDGLAWGGKVNGEIKVNGSTYRSGILPGAINIDGKAKNSFSTSSQIFKIKKNWELLPDSDEKSVYEFDYNQWPIEEGAPWDDINKDGVFTKGIDRPKFIGDETLFYVANDLDTAISRYSYGSDPIGLEFQTTVFGFNREDLKDVVFKKYRVINKSTNDLTDMYFTYWADDDLGFAGDDFEGFDTTYNMGYMFNGDNSDEGFYGTAPPAVAHMIVQGPIVPASNSDSARFNDGWRKGYKNLGMTSAGIMMKNSNGWPGDPELGVYNGSLEFYNYMRGLNTNGDSIINPITGQPTIWSLCGDPVFGTGWYEGAGWPGGPQPGDHRYHVPSGPFNLAAGDTQEFVIAIPIARGTDNINSITKLRELAAHVQEFYNNEFVDILNTKQTVAPTGYTLFQNYPNPFNPKTTIEYEVPEKSFVTIKIYDILGRKVQTLVNNEEQVRWKYKVTFDASTLASGVYFYRMQAGGFTETKKMMVLK